MPALRLTKHHAIKIHGGVAEWRSTRTSAPDGQWLALAHFLPALQPVYALRREKSRLYQQLIFNRKNQGK